MLQSVIGNIMSVPLEDTFLLLAYKGGDLLLPYVKPMEDLVLALLDRHFPIQSALFFDWVRTHQSPLASKLALMNPIHVALVIIAYLSIVFVGCIVMRGFSKFTLYTYSFFHNLFLTALSAYMAYRTLVLCKKHHIRIFQFDNSVDHSDAALDLAKILWLFYFSKVPEFIDTFIMILKKNFHQVSFLHVYHHASILAVQWLVVMWAPGGESALSVFLNSSVHVVMYGYYLCMAMGWKCVSSIKPFITLFQMGQFCYLMAQGITGWYESSQDPTYTNYPPLLAAMLVFYMMSMLALFGNFLVKDRRRAAKVRLDAKIKANKSQ